jgi:hypothetical protein
MLWPGRVDNPDPGNKPTSGLFAVTCDTAGIVVAESEPASYLLTVTCGNAMGLAW